ncbi:MAG TPA: PAS domain-containing protein [Parvibaculum sp.]|jgi:hypothetical protein
MLLEDNALIGYRLDEKSAPDHPANKWLIAYWEARRGAGGIPLRSDMAFSDLKSLLPGFFVVEPADQGRDFIFRLAGTEIEERLSLRVTGRRFTECYGDSAAGAINFYMRVLSDEKPHVLRGNFLGRGIEYADFEAVHMPVLGQSGNMQVCGTMFDMSKAVLFS